MRRGPTTFSLVLALLVAALVLALTLGGFLSTRAGLRALGDSYGRLVVATATSVDALASRDDPAARATLARLQRSGIRITTESPPPSLRRVVPVVEEVGHVAGELLGDPSRVVVVQRPEAQIWVRSERLPGHWIVMQAVSFRRQVIRSMLLVMLFAGLVAAAVAALAARLLTRPLERLAAHAPALLGGQSIQQHLRGSPREVRDLADALGAAGEELRQSARERELMLAGISHDLRTPLARLRLALELGDANDPGRRDAMVNDLDELDKALAQCLAYVRDGSDEAVRAIDIPTLLGQLMALRHAPDDWHYEGHDDAVLHARPSLLRRALGNLMDNAEHYGAAPFRVRLQRAGDELSISVEDHGPGVPEDLLARLGQPFLRGNAARTGACGTGLGLSIVKRAAEISGGRLQLANRSGGGFSATLVLPLAARERSPA
ncbi:ATP-binding protein [Dyella ginsengisoli]|uniref:ATP-binding protein n=1 Tax=Dyella ginsengisoli TaxID=363848 RepID=UPI00034D2606|nr:ATP-binding protein [Dyella ginsengisoli]